MGERQSELQRYADHTTIHGIRDFVSSKRKVLKISWGIFLLASGGLLCEEVYRTAKYYQSEPTSFDMKIIALEKFPSVHVCMKDWLDGTKARSLGFQDLDLAYLCGRFFSESGECATLIHNYPQVLVENVAAVEISIKDTMEKHNRTTVGDMLNLITWSIRVTAVLVSKTEPLYTYKTVEWLAWLDLKDFGSVCYSVTNVTSAETYYEIFIPKTVAGILVVGEDPFSSQVYEFQEQNATEYTIDIWDVNKLTLLNKRRDYCNDNYESLEVCLMDCNQTFSKCLCKSTSPTTTFPYNDEGLWQMVLFAHPCPLENSTINSCKQSRDICEQKCTPCTIWEYQIRVRKSITTFANQDFTQFRIVVGKRMKVSTEYLTYPASSLMSNIGGLMGLFCGASLLSLIQAVMFLLNKGCPAKKVKVMHGQKAVQTQQ